MIILFQHVSSYYTEIESAKLRTLRALLYSTMPHISLPYMLSCFMCLVPYVLFCLTCSDTSHSSCLTCSCPSRTLAPCLMRSRASCFRAHVLYPTFAHDPIVPDTSCYARSLFQSHFCCLCDAMPHLFLFISYL